MILFVFFIIGAVLRTHAVEDLEIIEIKSDENLEYHYKDNKVHRVNISDLATFQTNQHRNSLINLPGVHVPEQTTEPWTILNYRGLGTPQESQNVMILQDGLPVAFDIYGAPDHYYSPPVPLIEDIELMGGSSGIHYGPVSFATLNFLTPELKLAMPFRGRFNLAYGSYNLFSTVTSVTGSINRLSYWVGAHRKQGDGFQRVNGDFIADDVQWKIKYYTSSNLVLKSSFQGYNSDFGMPGGMALEEGVGLNTWGQDNRTATRKYNRLRIARAQLVFGAEKKLSSKTLVDSQIWGNAYRKYNKTQKGSGFGKVPTETGNMINTSQAYGVNALAKLKHKFSNNHNLNLGYMTYNTNSPYINEEGMAPDSNHGTVTSRLYRTTRANAIFADTELFFGRFSIVPGLRYENIHLAVKNERSDTYNVLLGGVESSYILSDTEEVYANVSRGFKSVGYEEILAQGNPNYSVSGDIKPSYNYFYETGLKSNLGKLKWDNSIYLIFRQNILASSGSVLSNASSAYYRGVESSFSYKGPGSFDYFANLNFVNARYKHGSFQGKTPGHVPSVLLKFGVTHQIEQKWKTSIFGTFVNEHYSDDGHTESYKVPSYIIHDFLVEFNLSDCWYLNGAINNLFDLQYYSRVMPTGVMPTMGRNFYLGLNYII